MVQFSLQLVTVCKGGGGGMDTKWLSVFNKRNITSPLPNLHFSIKDGGEVGHGVSLEVVLGGQQDMGSILGEYATLVQLSMQDKRILSTSGCM